jgi:putative ABC transport system permease protein
MTADAFYDKQKLADFRTVSTYGFDKDDIAEIEKTFGADNVFPGYYSDMFAYEAVNTFAVRVTGLSTEQGVNIPDLTEGRLPTAANECIISGDNFAGNFKIGDTVRLRPDGKNDSPLVNDAFTVTGYFKTPLAIDKGNYGTTSIGSGQLEMLIYIPEENFDSEYFFEVNIRLPELQPLISYEEDYKSYADEFKSKLETAADKRSVERLHSIKEEAQVKIDDAKAELSDGRREANEEFAKAEQELVDAKAKLDDAATEISDGEQEILDNRKKLDDGLKKWQDGVAELNDGAAKLAESEQEWQDGKDKYDDGLKKWQDGLKKWNDGKNEYDTGLTEWQDGYALYQQGVADWESGYKQYEDGLSAYKASYAEYEAGLGQYEAGLSQYEAAVLMYGEAALAEQKAVLDVTKAQLDVAAVQFAESKAVLDETKRQLDEAKQVIDENGAVLDSSKQKLDEAANEIESGKKELDDSKIELDEAEAELSSGREELDKAAQEIADGQKELYDSKREIDDGYKKLDEAESDLADGKAEYADGIVEYNKGEKDFVKEKRNVERDLAKAEREIAEAEQELADLDKIQWYVFSRGDNPGYTEYGDNANRIRNISIVFPVFFILVAALMCYTTVQRMIEEQRTGVGTLKALGYGGGAILFKYMLFALSSSLLGVLFGCLFFMKLLPAIIIDAYGIMYLIPGLVLPYNWALIGGAAVVATIVMSATVLSACLSDIRERPAELLRPKAPKAGKRVLLERVPLIWNRLSFSLKVSVRNVFRYKQRMFMALLGIAGCTALLLTGFGIKDSINDIVTKQFVDLCFYDGYVAVDDEKLDREELEELLGKENIVYGEVKTYTLSVGEKKHDVMLLVLDNDKKYTDEFYLVRNRLTGKRYDLSDGPILVEKAADNLGIADMGLNPKENAQVTIKITDTKSIDVPVAHISESYAYNWFYFSEKDYETYFGKPPEYNMVFFGGQAVATEQDRDALTEKLLKIDGVLTADYTNDAVTMFADLVQTLNLVVLIIIAMSGVLCYIVLYNLTDININERIREIATLKVLGFYNNEVDGYIFRENMFLTVIGAGCGLGLGVWLTSFIIKTVELSDTMFGREIHAASFAYAALLTAVFAALVAFFTHFKLIKVNMVESLKSIE